MRHVYEHHYANVHRGVYRLAERDRGLRGGARQGRAPSSTRPRARGDLRAQLDRGPQPRRVLLGAREPRARRRRRRHRARAPLELRARGSCSRSRTGATLRTSRSTTRRAPARRARRDRGVAARQDRREHPSRTRSARSTRSSSWQRGRTSAARSWSSTAHRRRRTARSTCRRSAATSSPSRRTSWRGRAARARCGAAGAAQGDAAVHQRRRDDPLGRAREDDVQQLPWKFEAGTPAIVEGVGFGAAIDYISADRPGGDRARTSTSSPPTRSSASPSSTASRSRPAGRPPRRDRLVHVEGVHPHDVAQILDWDGVASAPATTARSR